MLVASYFPPRLLLNPSSIEKTGALTNNSDSANMQAGAWMLCSTSGGYGATAENCKQ